MAAISDNLIHFLARADKESPSRQLEVFKLILQDGLRTSHFVVKYAHGTSIFNHVVCFTDIPLKECNDHTAVYGKFGIGFTKAFVKSAGGNPARYVVDYVPGAIDQSQVVESRGYLYKALSSQHQLNIKLEQALKKAEDFSIYDKHGNQILTDAEAQDYLDSLIYSFSFDKEIGDLGPARDETKEIDVFYKEREWRIVDLGQSIANQRAYKKSQDDTSSYYQFARSDVNMIVVPNEDTRQGVTEYLLSLKSSSDERLKQFGENIPPVICYDYLQKW